MSLIATFLAAFSRRRAFTRDDLKRAFRVGYINGLAANDAPTLKEIHALFEKKLSLHSKGVRP